ncbi:MULTISPECIES: hypothetical protein [Streptomyces]|uniref:Cold shock domain-containing protein n=1 Tax=Streptomyces sudanensis TaxID=436397 RepID=A0ABY4TI88_9ACTN|nr:MULTISPECIES: hypothetical protein [Streptomyces]URN16517.1 cold shock domain-containing protein [Streptomyces sudanensis]
MVTATVRAWREEEGWGVPDCPQASGGRWGHCFAVELPGFHPLSPGLRVEPEWRASGFRQDGYDYRAVRIVPRAGDDG